MERAVFTLVQVCNSIKKTVSDRYHATYWVKAEIYKLNQTPKGHAFPELVQRQDNKVLASMSGIIWKSNLDRIRRIFEQTVKEPFEEGKEVLMEIRIEFHEVYGLTLNISDVDPSFSLGALHKLRMETLNNLSNLGILQKNQQLNLPIPKRIAVISAVSSKGLSDFMNVINRTKGHYGIETYLFDSQVQGNLAAKSIISSLRKIQKIIGFFDVVVIVRGGGAEVGLSCYDDFELCKEIANFPIPVLCGIGHSTNLTAAEMVCHVHAITPSELAYQIINYFERQTIILKNYGNKVYSVWNQAIKQSNQTLNYCLHTLKGNTITNLRFENEQIINQTKGIHYFIPTVLKYEKQQFNAITKGMVVQGNRQILKRLNELSSTQNHLINLGKKEFVDQRRGLDWLEKQKQLLSPDVVLSRGYAIVRSNGKVLDDFAQIKSGQKINIQFNKGSGSATMD